VPKWRMLWMSQVIFSRNIFWIAKICVQPLCCRIIWGSSEGDTGQREAMSQNAVSTAISTMSYRRALWSWDASSWNSSKHNAEILFYLIKTQSSLDVHEELVPNTHKILASYGCSTPFYKIAYFNITYTLPVI
jgi:hypothetical protein